MKIKDIKGKTLLLNKTTLAEPPEENGWFLRLVDLRKASKNPDAYTVAIRDCDFPNDPFCTMNVFFDLTARVIGCRTFDKKTFNKILRAAGVKK